jgi:hypothetical protein
MMMKRIALFALLGAAAAVLGGCPIYPDDRDSRVCLDGECYRCPEPYYSSSRCSAWSCDVSSDCPSGYACGTDQRCRLGTPISADTCGKSSDCAAGQVCGRDNRCHDGSCSSFGCPSGQICKLSGGVAECIDGPRMPMPDGGTPGAKSTCASDRDCPTPSGSKCLSGACVTPADQCADATQCPTGQCVQGACTPSCSDTKPCPTGYACDTGKGVCTNNPGPCTSSAQCAGGNVCVEQRCVAPCSASGACAAGLVCVDGGCIADEKPVFSCAKDGVQDTCQPGSLCLRRSCYIGCDADAGADACKSADKFNVCKAVSTSSGSYSVCGSANNLGTECDPTQNKACTPGLVCIDGFCR